MTPLFNQKRWPLDAVCPGDALGSDPRGTERCLETQPVVARPGAGYDIREVITNYRRGWCCLIRFQVSG